MDMYYNQQFQLIFLVGLPGSGKTTYAKDVFVPEGFELFDDIGISNQGIQALFDHLLEGKKAVVTDIYSLTTEDRLRILRQLYSAVEPDLNLRWIFFENNADACIKNISKRKDDRLISEDFVRYLAKIYTIPYNAEVLLVSK